MYRFDDWYTEYIEADQGQGPTDFQKWAVGSDSWLRRAARGFTGTDADWEKIYQQTLSTDQEAAEKERQERAGMEYLGQSDDPKVQDEKAKMLAEQLLELFNNKTKGASEETRRMIEQTASRLAKAMTKGSEINALLLTDMIQAIHKDSGIDNESKQFVWPSHLGVITNLVGPMFRDYRSQASWYTPGGDQKLHPRTTVDEGGLQSADKMWEKHPANVATQIANKGQVIDVVDSLAAVVNPGQLRYPELVDMAKNAYEQAKQVGTPKWDAHDNERLYQLSWEFKNNFPYAGQQATITDPNDPQETPPAATAPTTSGLPRPPV